MMNILSMSTDTTSSRRKMILSPQSLFTKNLFGFKRFLLSRINNLCVTIVLFLFFVGLGYYQLYKTIQLIPSEKSTTAAEAILPPPPVPSQGATVVLPPPNVYSKQLIHKIKNVSILSLSQQRSFQNNAIVFLVQKKHTTYHRDSYGLLLNALDLLYKNYLSIDNNLENVDIYFFHTGDFNEYDLQILETRLTSPPTNNTTKNNNQTIKKSTKIGIVKLVNLIDSPYWKLPNNLKSDIPKDDWLDYNIFPIGYRHMCRFFGIKIWDFFDTMNKQHNVTYKYIWRMDEDSYIHSPIKYNIFNYMSLNSYIYGYRMCSYELTQNKFVPHWFTKWHNKIKPNRNINWNLCGFYNNFFIADISFFKKKKRVQQFLYEIDKRGFIYRKRYGDLIIHSMAIYAFAPTEKIHRFLDFTYQHITIDHINDENKGCIIWGGIQEGYLDDNTNNTTNNNNNVLDQFYKDYVIPNNCKANVTRLTYLDLSPTYSHLSEERKESISLKTISFGKVEVSNVGTLSG